jgi:hypothetical protein
MEKDKKKIITWGAIAFLVIIVLLWLMLRGSDIWQPENSTPVNENTSFIPPSKDLQYKPDAPPVLEETEFNVVNLAKDFAARFGSWSTDNQGRNLEELLPLSTDRMQGYLTSIQPDYEVEEFLGISSQSLSAKIQSIDDDSAVIMVTTQRVETNENLEENVYFQEIEIRAIKVGDKWLVDAAYWQE